MQEQSSRHRRHGEAQKPKIKNHSNPKTINTSYIVFFFCVLCASVVKMLLILGLFILFLNKIIRCSSAVPEGSGTERLKSQYEAQFTSKEEIEPFGVDEKKIIEAAISNCDGNILEAAAQLALSPSTLYRKVHAWRTDK
jgi:DNA-binding NtrC family response regulator